MTETAFFYLEEVREALFESSLADLLGYSEVTGVRVPSQLRRWGIAMASYVVREVFGPVRRIDAGAVPGLCPYGLDRRVCIWRRPDLQC